MGRGASGVVEGSSAGEVTSLGFSRSGIWWSASYRWHLLILWEGRRIEPHCGGGRGRVFFPIPVLLVGCEC